MNIYLDNLTSDLEALEHTSLKSVGSLQFIDNKGAILPITFVFELPLLAQGIIIRKVLCLIEGSNYAEPTLSEVNSERVGRIKNMRLAEVLACSEDL